MIYNGEARLRVPSGGLRLAVAEPNSRAKLAYALQNRASARRRRRRQDSNLQALTGPSFRDWYNSRSVTPPNLLTQLNSQLFLGEKLFCKLLCKFH